MNHQQMTVGKRYQLIRELSKSESISTYLATDLALPDRPNCVVKQFELDVAEEHLWQDIRHLCAKKASLWLKLTANHQIPQLLAYFEENRSLYLVQEYIEGETLQEKFAANSQISQDRLIYWLHDLLISLQIIHKNGIIHGNIKPDRLIIRDRDEKAFLVDFGIFQLINFHFVREVNSDASVNNVYYPSQIAGEPTAKSDLYALGIIVVQALTGIEPQNLTRNSTTERLLWPDKVKVNPKLVRILDKMVDLNPETTFISTEEAIEELNRLPSFFLAAKTMTIDPRPIETPQATYLPQPVDRVHRFSKNKKIKLTWFRVLFSSLVILAVLGTWEFLLPTVRPMYYLDRGKTLLSDEPESAFNYLQKAISLQPNNANAWKIRGDALFNLERLQAALASYDKACEIQPDYLDAWKGRGEVLYHLERFEAAIIANDKALQIEPKDAETLNRKGRALYKLERYQQALINQEAALKIQPNNVRALGDRGLALIGLGQYQQALMAFNRAQAIDPLNPQLWQNKGLVLQLLNRPQEAVGQYQEALAAYDRKIEENPNNIISIVDKANVLAQLQQYQPALATYEKALEINPDSHLAWIGKGNALFALRQYDKSLKAFDLGLKLQPESYLTWHNRGSLLRDGLRNLPEAIVSYNRAVEINPNFYHAWRDRGFALSQNQEQIKAIESFQKALNINKNDYKSWVGRGIALSSLDRLDEAIAAFDRAGEIQPKDPFVWMNKGSALERSRQYTEACDAYRQIKKSNPSFSPAIKAMSRLGCRQS
jgi:tetratricopeptide (TPR) repeat protein